MANYLSETGLAHLWNNVIKPLFSTKVDKVTGKGLSTLDFTQTHVNQIGAIQDATTALGSTKVDKIGGKGLSTNDFTTVYKDLVDDSAHGIALTVTLPNSGWSGTGPYTYTASVTGIAADNVILAGPAPTSKSAYEDCGAYPSAQGTGTLTFTAESVPTSAITVNVIVLNL